MTELARRRRALMAKTASGPVIPSGYVTNGLVFFLDALQGINGSTWTDIAGQKAFTLTDCVNSGNGIVFNGTSSKGVYNGSISSDWNNETIEAAISSSVKTTKDILCQPFQNASVGISLRLVRVNDNYQAAGTNLNASENSFFYFSHGSKLISVNRDRCVANKEQKTATSLATPSKVVTTTIGSRSTSAGSYSSYFNGTIYAIRIYNRKLTVDEMKQNQQADIDRYGITI